MKLVELQPLMPAETIFDLQYAKPYKETGEVFYEGEDAIARLDEPAALALRWAAQLALHQGLRLVIWDAHRPKEVQKRLIELEGGADEYVLDVEASNHPKGLAIDLTLADADGNLLDMGGGFDEFEEKSHANAKDLTPLQRQNRALLRSIMQEVGFEQWPYEWWHFNFSGRPDRP